jgi:16S rRNA processing protein RimM
MKLTRPKRVLLGRIAAAYGIRGEVLVRTFTEDPTDIASYGGLTDGDGGRPLQLEVVRLTPKGLIARVSGVHDRNGAEALKGAELWVERTRLPPLEEGSYYYVDLIGLEAVDLSGEPFGRVIAVENFGAGELLDIEVFDGARRELVPFKSAFVPDVDLDGNRVVIAWPLQFEIAQPGADDEDGGTEDAS